MTSPNTSFAKLDYDFTIGFLLVIFAFINWGINIYFGFITRNPWCLLWAVVSLIWALFAPVYISKAIDFEQWTFSMWGNSVWSAIRYHEYLKNGALPHD